MKLLLTIVLIALCVGCEGEKKETNEHITPELQSFEYSRIIMGDPDSVIIIYHIGVAVDTMIFRRDIVTDKGIGCD